MVGSYFDTPSFKTSSFRESRRASVNDLPGPSRSYSRPALSPLLSPGDDRSFELSETRGKTQNAGILKSTNRVKFDSQLDRRPSRSRSVTGASSSSSSLPQRPSPAAVSASADKEAASVQSLPLADANSHGHGQPQVIGLSIQQRDANSTEENSQGIREREGKAIYSAQERAQRLASILGRGSKSSPKISPLSSLPSSTVSSPSAIIPQSEDGDDIPMISLPEKQFINYDDYVVPDVEKAQTESGTSEARRLVQRIARRDLTFMSRVRRTSSPGSATPPQERGSDEYIERPTHYRGGVLSSLLRLYDNRENVNQNRRGRNPFSSRSGSVSDISARGLSPDPGWRIPPRQRKWHEKSPNVSNTSLSGTTIKDSLTSPMSMNHPPSGVSAQPKRTE